MDIDVVGHARQTKGIKQLFGELGYVPREMFNRMQGDRRLIFNDLEHKRRVDIFLDVFEMCHSFSFRDRLELDKWTLPLADLLITKLQIVETNAKDLKDIACLLLDHDIGQGEPDCVDGTYIARLAARDWGVYKTFTLNLEKIRTGIARLDIDESSRQTVRERVDRLEHAIETEPKTAKWKLRSAVGTSVRWYELPESDKEVIDSRAALSDKPNEQ